MSQQWQKSTSSTQDGGNSVEVSTTTEGLIEIRESDTPDSTITTTPKTFALWIEDVKRGEFDEPGRLANPMSDWQKSSISGNSNQCVEVRSTDEAVEIRESDSPNSTILTTPKKFALWIEGVKRGEFDHFTTPAT
ncbi:DUF397 domain-containing protein [Kitasatospora sp. NPDC093806]|uniref:DUF397 domain-containing protein n=1 Tax=Kitasatospora sp. NPDC093806 TaxID=3155075 RepID=UPI003436067F